MFEGNVTYLSRDFPESFAIEMHTATALVPNVYLTHSRNPHASGVGSAPTPLRALSRGAVFGCALPTPNPSP